MRTPGHYSKKPIVIRAIELNPETLQDIVEWIGTADLAGFDREECTVRIKTIEGVMEAGETDFVIQGVKGEFYPCKNDIFWMSYNQVKAIS